MFFTVLITLPRKLTLLPRLYTKQSLVVFNCNQPGNVGLVFHCVNSVEGDFVDNHEHV